MSTENKKILLVLSAAVESQRAIEHAVSEAKSCGAQLIALFLLDTTLATNAMEKLTDRGFIGEKPSTELSEAMVKDARQRGYEDLGVVQIKAMEEGVDFVPLMEEGDFQKKILEVIDEQQASLAVVTKKKEGTLSKYFSTPASEELKKNAPCTVVVFEE